MYNRVKDMQQQHAILNNAYLWQLDGAWGVEAVSQYRGSRQGLGTAPLSKDVLVVDDDKDICAILRDVLEAEGYRVTVAHNGQEALSVLRQQGEPALIVLDLMMPIMDGWEFAACLQEQPQWCTIPVVVVSADLFAARRRPTAHVVASIPKPFDIWHVAEVVQKYAA